MHFALPPRKISHSAPYGLSAHTSKNRRNRLKLYAAMALSSVVIVYLLVRFYSFCANLAPFGTPKVVIVTVLNSSLGKEYMEKIKDNRKDYAARHGYKTFFANVSDYDVGSSPNTWALVPALRHAITKNPHTTYFFALSPHSIIMNPSLSLIAHVMAPQRLESLMLKDQPVVPPDSVIHTFSHLKGDKVDLVLTQDGEGLCADSFIVRQGEWAKFFLDMWFDPLYRSYNFQKAEAHALEHVVQWHPTILTKLSLIPQRTINAYIANNPGHGSEEVIKYHEGDFLVRAPGCEKDTARNCEAELDPFYQKWKKEVEKVR